MGNEKVYDVFADAIIKKLEDGVVPWRKTWNLAGGGMPQNPFTPTVYSGFNLIWLACQGYGSPYWGTFKQISTAGGKVLKGEHGTIISYWQMKRWEETDDSGNVEEKSVMFVRYYKVWNLEQTENVKIPKKFVEAIEEAKVKEKEWNPIKNCEGILEEYKTMPDIKWGKNPCYAKGSDYIGMPKMGFFDSPEEYYAAFFHEMGHSTLHVTRLNRTGLSYAKEELVAEMCACFLCGIAGIEPAVIDNMASYISGWKKRIKGEPSIILLAASKAQGAANFIRNITEISKLKEASDKKKGNETKSKAA